MSRGVARRGVGDGDEATVAARAGLRRRATVVAAARIEPRQTPPTATSLTSSSRGREPGGPADGRAEGAGAAKRLGPPGRQGQRGRSTSHAPRRRRGGAGERQLPARGAGARPPPVASSARAARRRPASHPDEGRRERAPPVHAARTSAGPAPRSHLPRPCRAACPPARRRGCRCERPSCARCRSRAPSTPEILNTGERAQEHVLGLEVAGRWAPGCGGCGRP